MYYRFVEGLRHGECRWEMVSENKLGLNYIIGNYVRDQVRLIFIFCSKQHVRYLVWDKKHENSRMQSLIVYSNKNLVMSFLSPSPVPTNLMKKTISLNSYYYLSNSCQMYVMCILWDKTSTFWDKKCLLI